MVIYSQNTEPPKLNMGACVQECLIKRDSVRTELELMNVMLIYLMTSQSVLANKSHRMVMSSKYFLLSRYSIQSEVKKQNSFKRFFFFFNIFAVLNS